MNLTEICATLVHEPWQVQPDQLKWVTLRQVSHVYFHQRDEHGQLVDEDGGRKAYSYEDHFKASFRRRGATESQIAELWKRFLQQQGAKRQAAVKEGIVNKRGRVLSQEKMKAFQQVWQERWRQVAKEVLDGR